MGIITRCPECKSHKIEKNPLKIDERKCQSCGAVFRIVFSSQTKGIGPLAAEKTLKERMRDAIAGF